MTDQRALIFNTSDGSNTERFRPSDWGLLLTVALIWGSSFLWIAIGLDAFHPAAVAWLRVLFGAIVIWLVPAARRPVARTAWPGMAAVGALGNAGPALLFAFAQQRVESSVAGMLNASSPIFILGVAVLMTRTAPKRQQMLGLAVGLIGALTMAWPNLVGADAQPLGVLLVLGAVSCYATSNNIIPPLQQEYGGAAVVARALLFSSILLLPFGAYGLAYSSFAWASLIAVVVLGVVGTGLARTLFATAIGRVGAPRAAVVGYFVPIFATFLGVAVRNESLHPLEVLGTAIVLISAAIIGRSRS